MGSYVTMLIINIFIWGTSTDCNSEAFLVVLKENDIEALRRIPKSDLHNH